MTDFDLIIIGGGPAGLSAGFYAARLNLSVLILEKENFGGKITEAACVDNYPGFSEGISGPKLAAQLFAQANRWGVHKYKGEASDLKIDGEKIIIRTSAEEIVSRSVILAAGAEHKYLAVPGESDFIGNGLSFCALCDGPSAKDKPVAVIGAGDAGLSQAMYLLQFTNQITVIENQSHAGASPGLLNRALSDSKINLMLSTTVTKVEKTNGAILLHLNNSAACHETVIQVGAAFIAIGLIPGAGSLKDTVNLEKQNGWVVTDVKMKTNIPGVFAAGDIRYGSPRQAISAVADGAVAAISAFNFLKGSMR